MTYLNGPRLHFAGTFQVDVSTVNNYVDPFSRPGRSVTSQAGTPKAVPAGKSSGARSPPRYARTARSRRPLRTIR